jgi:hypothetical protein
MKGIVQKNGLIHFNNGIDMREIVEWFKQKKASVPSNIFETICSRAYEQLPFEKWIVLKTVLRLTEPVEAAA